MTDGPYLVWSGVNDWGGRWAKTREDFDEYAERQCADYTAGRITVAQLEEELEGCRLQVAQFLEA